MVNFELSLLHNLTEDKPFLDNRASSASCTCFFLPTKCANDGETVQNGTCACPTNEIIQNGVCKSKCSTVSDNECCTSSKGCYDNEVSWN